MHDIGDRETHGRSRSGVEVEDRGAGVATIRLGRTAKRNAVDLPLVTALRAAFDEVTAPVVVLESADDACFCAGADRSISASDRREVSDLLYQTYEAMIDHPALVIAAVGGYAIGGGAQLAVAADLRIGNPATEFRFVGPGHGLAVGAWALPSIVGRGRAIELAASMRPVLADEAHRIGLLNAVVPDVVAGALDLAGRLALGDAAALGRLKAVVLTAGDVRAALRLERETNREAWSGTLG